MRSQLHRCHLEALPNFPIPTKFGNVEAVPMAPLSTKFLVSHVPNLKCVGPNALWSYLRKPSASPAACSDRHYADRFPDRRTPASRAISKDRTPLRKTPDRD